LVQAVLVMIQQLMVVILFLDLPLQLVAELDKVETEIQEVQEAEEAQPILQVVEEQEQLVKEMQVEIRLVFMLVLAVVVVLVR
jgi:hypothetical protein